MPVQKSIQLPIGTLEEVRAQGMDPSLVATCHQHLKDNSIRGCPYETTCMFHRRALGGFKGKGPHNVGYYLRTSNSDGARQIESIAPCYRFVATLQARMLSGMDRKNRGLDHEVIQVIAQEGEEIFVRSWKTEALDGGNKTKNYKMTHEDVFMKVPAFLRPGENPGVTYDNKLDARAAARDKVEHEMEDMLAEQMAERSHRPDVPEELLIEEPVTVPSADTTPTVTLATPAKKPRYG